MVRSINVLSVVFVALQRFCLSEICFFLLSNHSFLDSRGFSAFLYTLYTLVYEFMHFTIWLMKFDYKRFKKDFAAAFDAKCSKINGKIIENHIECHRNHKLKKLNINVQFRKSNEIKNVKEKKMKWINQIVKRWGKNSYFFQLNSAEFLNVYIFVGKWKKKTIFVCPLPLLLLFFLLLNSINFSNRFHNIFSFFVF